MNARLRRADSFVGIHFDFHARNQDTAIGRGTTRESVLRILDAIAPDYVEVDCKGHHGISSYPTTVGTAAPGIIGDPLRVWREATADRGVALYVHYSGVQDAMAVKLHPGWARVDETGTPDPLTTSLYSPYVDELMIPQLKELIDVYDIDGVWVDGDAWGARLDYSPAAVHAFTTSTGLSAPRSAADEGWLAFAEFQRDAYLRYLRHYTDTLHHMKPDFQVGSAWAFSSFLPREVSASVDYLSGDTSAINHNFARLEARLLDHQRVPWDLMTWSFGGHFELDGPPPAVSLKSAPQLMQEAATIVTLGGGYQTVSNQKMDGSVIEWQLPTLAAVAEFCRERRPWVTDTTSRSDIALLHSTTAFNRATNNLMNALGELDPLLGTLEALLDRQFTVDVLMEHQLRERLSYYRLVVIPEWVGIEPKLDRLIRQWVHGGGRLLVTGAAATADFDDLLGVKPSGPAVPNGTFWIEGTEGLAGHQGSLRHVEAIAGAEVLSQLHRENDYTDPKTAATLAAYGEGLVAGIYIDFGHYHHSHPTEVAKQFIDGIVDRLLPDRAVTVRGSHLVDVVVRAAGDATIVHLINTAGQQRDLGTYTFAEIPVLGPLTLEVRSEHRPQSVRLQPVGLDAAFEYGNGICSVTIPRLEIHTAVVITAGSA